MPALLPGSYLWMCSLCYYLDHIGAACATAWYSIGAAYATTWYPIGAPCATAWYPIGAACSTAWYFNGSASATTWILLVIPPLLCGSYWRCHRHYLVSYWCCLRYCLVSIGAASGTAWILLVLPPPLAGLLLVLPCATAWYSMYLFWRFTAWYSISSACTGNYSYAWRL